MVRGLETPSRYSLMFALADEAPVEAPVGAKRKKRRGGTKSKHRRMEQHI